jgi:hypothetical protein
MQLIRAGALAASLAGIGAASGVARAEDKVDLTTTWYQEARQGGLGGLTVVHPQLDIGIDLGETVTLDAGWSADAVTGATAAVYSVDAISSATKFEDLRNEGHLALGFVGRRSQLGFSASVGAERDYLSLTFGGSGSIDLPGKNTNLALSYTHNLDQVCDRDNAMASPLERRALTGDVACPKNYLRGDDRPGVSVWRDVTIDTAQATVTQNLSPTTNLQLSLWGQIIEGFQSNPYRSVRVGALDAQEHSPATRARGAVSARLNRFIPLLRAAAHLSARGYSDTWGVSSGTLEAAWSQYAGDSLLLKLRARIYQQSAATFFKDAFFYEVESTAGEYFTGDRELAPVRNALVGAKLTILTVAEDDERVWGLFDKLQVNLKGDVLLLDELAADDPDANVAGTDSQFLTSGQLVDAFIVQAGLLLEY